MSDLVLRRPVMIHQAAQNDDDKVMKTTRKMSRETTKKMTTHFTDVTGTLPPFMKLPIVRTETLVTDLDPPPPPDQ